MNNKNNNIGCIGIYSAETGKIIKYESILKIYIDLGCGQARKVGDKIIVRIE